METGEISLLSMVGGALAKFGSCLWLWSGAGYAGREVGA
jgi:hypothetical protein